MRVLQIISAHESSDAEACLAAADLAPLGVCTMRALRRRKHHLLVRDGELSIDVLRGDGITAVTMDPPQPVTKSAVVWWKNWREVLAPQVYFDFRQQHHDEILSIGSMVRVRESDSGGEPWRLLGDAGVDIRCAFHCVRPAGLEFHLLLPDADKAIRVLNKAGIPATHMDYRGPALEQGISWWGEWKPALAYAKRVQRPILMSFASPRVEQVPGLW